MAMSQNYLAGEELYCPCCNTKKNIVNFYPKYWEKKKYLPLCKRCTDNIATGAFNKYQSIGAAMWSACCVQNIPMLEDIYEIAEQRFKQSDKLKYFDAYFMTLKELGRVFDGVYDSDISLSDFVNIENNQTKPTLKLSTNGYEDLIKCWGRFTLPDGKLDVEAYEFLEDLYAKYTEDILEMDTAMELTYRDLCIAHWQKRKADENNEIAEVEKAKKQINNALSLLNLDQFKNNSLSEEQKHIEHICWEIENTTPAECEDLEKYKDFSGFEKPFAEIMRCVRNLIAGTKEYPDIPKENI